MGGEETTRLIRSQSSKPEVPIVAFTAHAMKEDRKKYLLSGMDEYLTKPMDKVMLFEAIERLTKKE